MRRRIYVDPEGPLCDSTSQPCLWREDDVPEPGEPFGVCRVGALYDDNLWKRYCDAELEAERLRSLVIAALVAEPYDDTERSLSERATAALDRTDDAKADLDELSMLGVLARAHAATRTKP